MEIVHVKLPFVVILSYLKAWQSNVHLYIS